MTPCAAALHAGLSAAADEGERLALGLRELETLYARLIRAFLPENPQFERERIIVALPDKREIVFICGFFNEGENEAALLLELIAATLLRDPAAPTLHLLEEMSYYLRTSVDEAWQLQDEVTSASAALLYLLTQLEERLQLLLELPVRPLPDVARERRALLAMQTLMPLSASARQCT